MNIGFLHPGEMGISLAAAVQNSGHTACWVSAGRGRRSAGRAERYQLTDSGTLQALCDGCPVIISVCPPHAAESVAGQVRDCAFTGIYLEANAISPARSARIESTMTAAGIRYVDGGIIGPPAWEPGKTWLYLSGKDAAALTSCFSSGPLQTAVIGGEAGLASALKMTYAAYNKGRTALLAAVLAAAEEMGVREDLERHWAREEPGSPDAAWDRIGGTAAKAWRFTGEMEEIAATLRAAGVPGEFHDGAREVYARLAHFKGTDERPDPERLILALLGKED